MWSGGTPTAPLWSGNPVTQFPNTITNLTIDNLISSNITTTNLTAYNAYLSYIENITTTTNAVILQPATILTGDEGSLYINGSLAFTASNFSNIGEWSRFAAVSDVDLSFSTIMNVSSIYINDTYWGKNLNVSTVRGSQIFSSNINNSNQITTKNLIATTGVAAPTVEGVNVSGVYGSFPTLSCSDLTSSTQSNANLLQTRLLRVNDSAQVVGTLSVGLDITGNTVIRVPEMRTTNSYVYTELRVAPIFPVSPDTGSIITPTLITGDGLLIRDTANINTAIVSGNATVNGTTYTRNISNTSNILTGTLNTNTTATVGTTLTVNGGTFLNGGLSVPGNITAGSASLSALNMNGNIVFPYNTIGGIVLPPNQQWLYDIQNVRNITCGSLTVVGGATGDEFFPPLHYASEVTIGNDGGLTSQGVVVINGQLPDPADPGTNLTNALTVRGDMVVDFGVLTTYNGLVCLPFSLDANALEVTGITFLNGAVNVIGSTTIEGTTGILGNTTITGALEVTGGCLFTGGLAQQAGDWTLGNFGTGYTGIINTATTINGSLNMAGFNVNNVGNLSATNGNFTSNVSVAGTLTATNGVITNLTTSNIRAPSISTINISTGTIFTSSIRANNISTIFVQASNITATNNLTASALSTTIISTATIFTNFVNAPGNLNINASSNINVVASNYIYCQALNECAISTIKITLTRDVYMSNIYGIGGTNIRVNDNINMSNRVLYASAISTDDVYTRNLRNKPGVPDPINVLNPLNMCNYDISNINNLTTSNITASNGVIANLSTNILNMYPTPDQNGVIAFFNSNAEFKTIMGLSDDTNFLMYNFGTLGVYAAENLEISSASNATLQASSGIATVTSLATGVLISAPVGGIQMNSLNDTTISSQDSNVFIVSNNGFVSLIGEIGVGLNDSSNANLVVGFGGISGSTETANIEFTTLANDINLNSGSNINLTATGNITLTGNVYMSNIYGIGATNITVNDNIDMSSSVLYAGAVHSDDIYVTNLHKIDSIFDTTNSINVLDHLNMTNCNISNVNKMYYGATRQPFIQFGSNNTGASGVTVTLPVPYSNATYAVQLTYIGIPGGSQTLYLISQTTSNFRFHGHNNSPTYWTTLGFNN